MTNDTIKEEVYFEVGMVAYSAIYGKGVISSVHFSLAYPILFTPGNNANRAAYTHDGRLKIGDNIDLFQNPPKFDSNKPIPQFNEVGWIPFNENDFHILGKSIKRKNFDFYYLITGLTSDGIHFGSSYLISFKTALEDYTFLDGSPCGKLKQNNQTMRPEIKDYFKENSILLKSLLKLQSVIEGAAAQNRVHAIESDEVSMINAAIEFTLKN
jgi:hypothetical protein